MKNLLIALLLTFLSVLPSVPVLAADETAKPAETTAPAAQVPPPATPAAEVPKPSVFLPAAEPAKAAAPRFGYVDVTRAATESEPGKAAMTQVKERGEKLTSQINERQKKLEKMKGEIEAKLPTLTQEQRAAKAKEFQKKVEEFQKFVKSAEKEMKTKEEELTGKLFKSIEEAAREFGKAGGYAAIVARKELLYSSDEVRFEEVTDEIVKLVNAKRGGK
jgi:outer membrane protein